MPIFSTCIVPHKSSRPAIPFAISEVNASDALKLAIDVPSGLILIQEKHLMLLRADMAVTFHKLKTGMAGREDLCGTIHVEKIGIPPEAEKGILS